MSISKGRILCTEDDPDTLEVLNIILTHEGFEVVCSNSAANAIELARSQHFDLCLVDNWMPDLSGVDFTEKLRRFDVKTPVLFYSSAAFASDKEAARLSGAQGYLVKPVANADLIAEVIRLIAESKIARPLAIVTHATSPSQATD